eukprot:89279_1
MSVSSSMRVSLIHQTRAFRTRRRYSLFNSTVHELEAAGSVNDSCRFISMSVLTSTMMLAEIITGVVTGSLTLLSDALHMLSDLIALIIGFIAHRMANGNTSKNNSFEHTMVYMRYEIVGALINGTILLTSCFIMGLEAIQRMIFFNEEIENVDYVLIVGGLGLLINLIGLVIFGHHGHSHGHSHSHDNTTDVSIDMNHESDHSDQGRSPSSHKHQHHHDHTHGAEDENLNIRGVFLHILGDLLGSVAVIVSSLVIKFSDGWWTIYVDPACTLFIVLLISRTAWPLVRQSANILLDKSPFDPNVIAQIEKELRHISGVLNVHELRCWEVKTGYYMATVHLIIDPELMDDDHTDKYCAAQCDIMHDKMTIIDQSKAILHKYGIHSSIVQSVCCIDCLILCLGLFDVINRNFQGKEIRIGKMHMIHALIMCAIRVIVSRNRRQCLIQWQT